MEISGKLYLSGKSKSLPAVLLWRNGSFWLQSNFKEINRKLQSDEMAIDTPLGSLPYKILMAEGLVFEAKNNQETKEFLEFCEKPISESWLNYLEQKKSEKPWATAHSFSLFALSSWFLVLGSWFWPPLKTMTRKLS